MKNKAIRILLVSVCAWGWLLCSGQQFEVKNFTCEPADLSAVTSPRSDRNGKPCALVKVQVPMPGVAFEGNVVGKTDFKAGEYWVYLSGGSKYLMVKHASCSPTRISFAGHGITVSPKKTYVLTLAPPKSVMADVTFKVTPEDAILMIDNAEYELTDGMTVIPLSCKEHTYTVVANGYTMQTNIFRVNGNATNKIVVELDPKGDIPQKPILSGPEREQIQEPQSKVEHLSLAVRKDGKMYYFSKPMWDAIADKSIFNKVGVVVAASDNPFIIDLTDSSKNINWYDSVIKYASYLPSQGQAEDIIKCFTALDKAITEYGGETMDNKHYWVDAPSSLRDAHKAIDTLYQSSKPAAFYDFADIKKIGMSVRKVYKIE